MIKEGFKTLLKNKAHQLITVSKYDYPPEKTLVKVNNKFIKLKNKNYFNSRTQDLNNHFKDTGSLYFYKIDKLIKKNLISKITFLEVPKYTLVDVDSPEDLKFLKLLYKKII
jgi:N-acylneuraminate cytidylyltransferase